MDTVPQSTALVISSGNDFRMNLDQCVLAWLHAKSTRTDSEDTKKTYTFLMDSFRSELEKYNADLDSDPHLIAVIVQGWAAYSSQKGKVAPATFNHRLAVISSFFRYAIKHEVLKENPINIAERRPVEARDYAMPIEFDELQKRLAKIDRRFLPGKRDYALLSVAVTTGRRSKELASMKMGDLQFTGSKITVTFPRCKNAKKMRDILAAHVSEVLIDYLKTLYGDYKALPPETPIWLSFARNGSRGEPIGKPAISDICKKWLGTSKVHSTRHSFAINSEKAGASLSEIGARLGHSNLATTSVYMQRLHSAENPYADKLAEMFGIGGE